MNILRLLASIPLLLGLAATATAAPITKGDVTATLGPDFFFDTASTGGGDNSTTEFNRDYNGTFAGKALTITGIGWASSAGGTTAGQSTATFTDLGPDDTFGTTDDVFLGSVNDSLIFSGAGEYYWSFDNPIGGVMTGNIVRIRMFQGSPIVRKTTSGTAQAAVKLSLAGTAVTVVDLDEDGIHDPWETNTGEWVSIVDTGTDPGDNDSDNDDLLDGWENNSGVFTSATNTGTDPNKFDSDEDTFSDGIEKNTLVYNGPTDPGTNPNKIDTDNDTFNDNIENNSGIYNGPTDPGTDPTLIDSDFDGLNDNIENNSGVYNGLTNPGTNPNHFDSEDDGVGDGMDDGWEVRNGTDPHSDDSLGDLDSDDLDNLGEYLALSDPQDPDSDNDTLSDGIEANPAVIGFTDTSPTNRDSDGDRLSDAVETNTGTYVDRFDTGSDPNLANSDTDAFPDGIEVLFYGSNPNLDTSFPGDGIAPAPGSLTTIQDAGNVPPGSSLDVPSTLGSAIINEAEAGGADFTYGNGNTNFVAIYPNAFPAPGTNVSLSGFAWVVAGAGTANGDVLIEFYDPGAGTFNGIDQATFLGSAVGTLTTTGSTTVMYWNFDTPITFTSEWTSLAVRIQSTASLRIKAQDNFASGEWEALDGSGYFGNIRTSRFSIGGTAVVGGQPEILTFTRVGTTNTLTWDLNGAASVNVERSTDLGVTDAWTKVLSNTTETSYSETSTDPKAFFRLSTP